MKATSLDAIFGDFTAVESEPRASLKGGTVTIWLSPEDKSRYDRLQEVSGRRFSKKVRKVILAAIDLAEARIESDAPATAEATA